MSLVLLPQWHSGLYSATVMNSRRTATHLFLAAAIGLLTSCAKPAYEQRGWASYIADHYAGHHTSSGEVYYPQGWTAAHNSLPFGTQVKVKNNCNGKSVNLTVNDHFPQYSGRVINVSRAAAEYLQIPFNQLGDVTVTAKTIPGGVPPTSSQQSGYYGAPPPNYNAMPPPTSAPPPAFNAAPPPGYGLPPAR